MQRIEKSITINAPARKVFDYVSDPARLPALWPSMAEVYDIEPGATSRRRYRWLYRLCGVRFEGESETTEYRIGERLHEHWRGGLQGTIGWVFAVDEDGTRVTLTVDFAVPLPLQHKHSQVEIEAEQSRCIEGTLRNLKLQLEQAPVSAS